MSKTNLDQFIKSNLVKSSPIEGGIDVRKETMARIEALEIKREKIKYFSVWFLSLFTSAVCIVSLVLFENIFNHFRFYLLLNQVNPVTLKLIFQGIFGCILVGLFVLMTYLLSSRDQLFYIPEV